MFSNKGYGWKLLAALTLIAVLGVSAHQRGEDINPALWRCVVEPRRWDGHTIWIPEARIAAIGGGGYEITHSGLRIPVTGPAPAPVGGRITLRAVFRGGGPLLERVQARPLPEHHTARRVMEIVSLLVLLGVTVNLLRHFAFRPRLLQVAGRTDP